MTIPPYKPICNLVVELNTIRFLSPIFPITFETNNFFQEIIYNNFIPVSSQSSCVSILLRLCVLPAIVGEMLCRQISLPDLLFIRLNKFGKKHSGVFILLHPSMLGLLC